MTIIEWLNTSLGMRRESNIPYLAVEPTILQYLAELVYVNKGSLIVRNFGHIEPGVGAYGRLGLTVQESFQLTELAATLNGLLIAIDGNPEMKITVHTIIQNEIRNIEKTFLELNSKTIVLPGPEDVTHAEKSRIIVP